MTIRTGCAVVAARNGRTLLGKRGKEPMYGKWILPGGGIKRFERYAAAGVREVMEETGLTIEVRGVLMVAEIINPPDEHRIVIYVEADIVGDDEPEAGSDLLEAGLFTKVQMQQMAASGDFTPTVQDVLAKLGRI